MRYLTLAEIDATPTRLGVPVAWLGEDDDMVAITGDTRRGTAAIHQAARLRLHGPMSCTDVSPAHARFIPGTAPDPEWEMQICGPGDPGALPVVIASEIDTLPNHRRSA